MGCVLPPTPSVLLLVLLLLLPSSSYNKDFHDSSSEGPSNPGPNPPQLDPDKLRFLQTTGLTSPLTPSHGGNFHEFMIRHQKHREHVEGVDTLEELIYKLRLKNNRRNRRAKKGRGGEETLTTEVSSSSLNNTSKKLNITWPLKRVALIPGDIWLGGLMMVHEREDEIICGPIMPQGGIQALETMMYTIDWVNNRSDYFLPGIKIGAHILDDCDKDTYGLEQAVDFIKGSISNIDSSIETGAICEGGNEEVGGTPSPRKHNVIAGVVGAPSSVTSIQVANLLRLFKIPQVSFFSTSPELSNKQRFEFFSRTIPSDKNQVKVMVELLKTFGWSYVSIIYEESNYGIKAFEEFERLLPENNICIATKEKLVKDSGVAGDNIYERIVDKLIQTGKAKGVIVYGSDQEVKDLMRAVARKNATGQFSWIGSDGWSARALVSDGNEAVVEGTLSVQPKAVNVKGFREYFLNLNPKENLRNPWFVEFWEAHFSCKFPHSARTPYNQGFYKVCSGLEKLEETMAFEDQLQYVSDAVMSFAYAFRDMHRDLCNGTRGLCPRMNPVDGTELLNYLKKVEFTGLSGDDFHFDEFQDGPARYNIIHFRRNSNGSYHWTRVGDYNEGLLTLNMSEIWFTTNSSTPPPSVCSEPCLRGEAKQYFGGDKCCWNCFKCQNYYVVDPEDESECYECPLGTLPNDDHTECVAIEEEYLKPTDGWAIFSMSFSSIGIIITMTITLIFVVYNDTPVVRASSRELTYVILFGLFGCFALTFLFVLRPTNILCGIQLFLTGFIFTILYSALLTKTNRIARIFKAGRKSAKRPSFISPKSQMVICGMFCVIQMLIIGMWLLVDRPSAIHFYPTRHDNLLICQAYVNHSYVVAFFYPILVILICTVYAVLTRKIPADFNESKCIGFTMYTTSVIWLAFVPIYFSTGQQVSLRITSMSVAISLSAYVMIVCLFGPKLHIILLHPERNVRASMLPSTRNQNMTLATTAGKHNSLNNMEMVGKHGTNCTGNSCSGGGGGGTAGGGPTVDKSTQMEETLAEDKPLSTPTSSTLPPIKIHPVINQTTQTENFYGNQQTQQLQGCHEDCHSMTTRHRFSFKKERGENNKEAQQDEDPSGGDGESTHREVVV